MASRMFNRICVLILLALVLQICAASECKSKNIMCSEIGVAEGFRYEHKCPEKSEISVEGDDKMNFGSADLRKQEFRFVLPVVKMDNRSVITEACQDLNITCTLFTENHEKLTGEKCVNFKTNHGEKPPPGNLSVSPSPPTQDQSNIGSVGIAAVVILLVVGFGLIFYYCWKKKKGGGISTCPQRNQEGSGFPMVPGGDLEGQNNADVRNGEDPRGCGENDRDALQSAVSGNKGSPDTTAPSNHRPMNGNMNEEPDGINGTKGRGNKTELDGGGAAAHHGPEEQPLLPDQRAAGGDFNRFSADVTFVNELSSKQDPVGRCSATPDADVESPYTEKPTH